MATEGQHCQQETDRIMPDVADDFFGGNGSDEEDGDDNE